MSRQAWALFVAMSLLWGVPYLLIKVAVAELDPSLVVFVRLALASIVLVPFAFATGALRRVRGRWRSLATISVVGIVAPFLLIGYGEQHITSSLAALLIAADPLFIVVLAVWLDASERMSGLRLVGLCLGLVGVAVLLGLNVSADELGLGFLGSAFVLIAALCYALSALLVKRLGAMPALGTTSVTLTTSAVLLAPLAAATMPRQLPSWTAIASLVVLGILCTAIAYVIYYELIAAAGAGRASLITYVNPAVAVVLGVLVLGEPVTTSTILGFGLIIVGCAVSTGTLERFFGIRARRPIMVAHHAARHTDLLR